MNTTKRLLLAGDIGGTKSALALVSDDPSKPVAEARFPTNEYSSLEAIVAEFLSSRADKPTSAVFGIAGPIVDGRSEVTNVAWTIDSELIEKTFGFPVRLINDLESIAFSIPYLVDRDLHTLNPGQPMKHGSIAVIAPGTGLGEAFSVWNGTRYQAYASEGGHSDFGPVDSLQRELLDFLTPRLDHVSYEWVCSGKGIPNLYSFLRETNRASEPEWLRASLAETDDPTRIIVQAAVDRTTDICVRTIELFVSILGSEAGNLALKVLATGGVYLGGGIPPRVLGMLQSRSFMEAFTRKGRFAEMLEQMPVRVILFPDAALLGAAHCGLEA